MLSRKGQGWVVVACNFVAQMLTHGVSTSMGVFYVQWKTAFPDDVVMISWLASSVLAMLLGTSPFTGAITRHFGIRAVMIVGALLSASGFIVASFAQNIVTLFITIAGMTGFGNSLAYSGSLLSVAENFQENYAFYNGIASVGCGLGMVLLPIVLQALVEAYSWRGALMVLAALQIHIIPLACILSRFRRIKRPRMTKLEGGDLEDTNCLQADKDQCDSSGVSVSKMVSSDDADNVLSDGHNNVKYDENVNANTRTGSRDDLSENNTQFVGNLNENEGVLTNRGPCSNGSDDATVQVDMSGTEQLDKDTDDMDENTKRLLYRRLSRRATSIAQTVQTSVIDSTGLSLLWTNRVFCCFLPAIMLGGTILGTVLVHIGAVAISGGTTPLEAAFLISVVGIANIVSRGAHGYILDSGVIYPMIMNSLAYGLAALSAILIPVAGSYALIVVCAAGIGLASGIYIPMQNVMVRHMVGLYRFPGAIGITFLAVCFGNMSSSIISGYVYDQTGNYLLAFCYTSVCCSFASVLLIVEHVVFKYCLVDERWPPKMKRRKQNSQKI